MSDVLIGELDELDLTLVASTSNKATTSRRNDATIFEMVKSEFEKFTLAKDGSKINGIVERYHRTVDEMANAFYHGMMTPNFFWKYVYRHLNWIYNRLVHSGLISFPICFCQTTPFLTGFTLCFVT